LLDFRVNQTKHQFFFLFSNQNNGLPDLLTKKIIFEIFQNLENFKSQFRPKIYYIKRETTSYIKVIVHFKLSRDS
jgi:hypothetical protein